MRAKRLAASWFFSILEDTLAPFGGAPNSWISGQLKYSVGHCFECAQPIMLNTRVLLITDVVDSTLLIERLGDDAAAALWAAHDRVARDLLPAWQGREIDKTDGMLLMFESVAQAVSYALAYQAVLRTLPTPLLARAGLHCGPVVLRENSAADVALGAKPLEVDGLTKPQVARVMSLASGGQLLLTQEARAALEASPDDVPIGVQLTSHGHWMLKGVSHAHELFEASVGPPSLPPPRDADKAWQVVQHGERWLPVREIANNLPQQSTSFIGREREQAELKTHLQQARLVTLLGMGGLGKTRLSLQVAQDTVATYPDGVWFVDLAPVRDAERVVTETAQVLGLRDEPDQTVLQVLCAYAKTRRMLLVLDNCEHLLQAAAELVHAVLRAAPQVRFMASSREALHVPGEVAYPVLPLPVPGRGAGLQAVAACTAVRLFVERAQAHKPSFALTEHDADAVAELVGRLEGIPLALELAAARVRAMSVADINLRLRDRYKMLTGGSRVLQERQQTLRALVDWSYDLLNPAEQITLQRVSVFVDGFDLAAAEAVCGAEPIDTFDVMDLLTSLVEKSLLMMQVQGENTRYRALDTITEYAREKHQQTAAGEDRNHTLARHSDHYFALVSEARVGLQGAEQALWVARLEAELDNVRAVIALALQGGVDPFIAVKLAVKLQGFWLLRGYASEGREVVRAALALPAVQASATAQGHALYVGGVLAEGQSDYQQARTMLQICLTLRRGFSPPVEIAATLSTLSLARLHGGDLVAAVTDETEALGIFARLDDQVGMALSHLHLGQFALAAGQWDEAKAQLNHALAIAQRIGHREVHAEAELHMAEWAFENDKLASASEHAQQSLHVSSAAADRRGEANAHHILGRVALASAELASAAAAVGATATVDWANPTRHLSQALQAFDAFDMHDEALNCLEDHARLALRLGRYQVASELAMAIDPIRQHLALGRRANDEVRWAAWLVQLSEARPQPFAPAATRWTLQEATAQALAALAVQSAPSNPQQLAAA
jgi:predicted ATPase